MSRKLKFKPEITRIKLNPEQAVLECICYTAEKASTEATSKYNNNTTTSYCDITGKKEIITANICISHNTGDLTPASCPDDTAAS